MNRYSCLLIACGVLLGACGDGGNPSSGGGGAGGTGAAGGAGGTGGTGGTGGSGGSDCVPGETEACYSGPSGTDGVGLCHGGQRTCGADGKGFGPCEGEVLPEVEQCAVAGDENCDGLGGPVCTGDPLWSKSFAGPQGGSIDAIATDGLGNVLIGGGSGGADFGGGPLAPGPYLAKLGPNGNHVFSKSWSGFGIGSVAAETGGGMLLLGLATGPVNLGGGVLVGGQDFVAGRFDPQGNHVWSRRFPADGAQNAWGLSAAGDGCFLAGMTVGSVDLGGGALSPEPGHISVGALGKLDTTGNHVWSRSLGDSVPLDLVTLPGGGVAVTGFFFGSYDFGGGVLSSGAGSSVFVAAYDGSGNHLFSRVFVTKEGVGTSISANQKGEVAVAGWFDTSIDLGGGAIAGTGRDMFVVKLGPDGSYVFGEGFGGAGDEIARGAVIDEDGSVFFSGGFPGIVDFGGGPLVSSGMRDLVVVRLDPTGHHDWSHRYGDAAEQFGRDMALSSDGYLFLGGVFEGTLELLPGSPLVSAGGSSAFLAKLAR